MHSHRRARRGSVDFASALAQTTNSAGGEDGNGGILALSSSVASSKILRASLLFSTSAMAARGNALWDSLSSEMKHEMAALAAAWQFRRARRIEQGIPASSLEVFDDDPTMETGFDNNLALEPMLMHVSLTME